MLSPSWKPLSFKKSDIGDDAAGVDEEPTNHLNPNRRLVPPYLVMEENKEQNNERDVRWQSRFHNAIIYLRASVAAEMNGSLRKQAITLIEGF